MDKLLDSCYKFLVGIEMVEIFLLCIYTYVLNMVHCINY